MSEDLKLHRILKGKTGLRWAKWQKWSELSFNKYWSGRLFYLNISKVSFTLDCRIDWLADMITGKPA